MLLPLYPGIPAAISWRSSLVETLAVNKHQNGSNLAKEKLLFGQAFIHQILNKSISNIRNTHIFQKWMKSASKQSTQHTLPHEHPAINMNRLTRDVTRLLRG